MALGSSMGGSYGSSAAANSSSPESIIRSNSLAGRMPLAEIWRTHREFHQVSRSGYLWLVLGRVFSNLGRSIATAAITVLTVAVVVLTLLALTAGLSALRGALSAGQQEVRLTLFLADPVTGTGERLESSPEVQTMFAQLKRRPEVESVRFLGKSEALNEMRSSFGGGQALVEGLEDRNPLPDAVEIRLARELATEPVFAKLADYAKNIEIVDEVHYSQGVVRQISLLVQMASRVAIAVLLVGLLIAGFVVWNTIFLALHGHRDEIEILRLLGATYRDISLPYLVEGTFQGIAGAALGVALLYGVRAAVLAMVSGGDSSVVAAVEMFNPGVLLSICAVFVAGLLGMLGSYIAVRKFLIF